METLMGYKADHLIGKSLYDCHHGHDSESLIASFKCCKYIFNTFLLYKQQMFKQNYKTYVFN